MQNGWIKIHRRIMEKCYYKKSIYIHLWLHLLLTANHDQKQFMWNNNIMVVKEGQLITGRKELSAQTGIPESSVERILDFLEKDHQIEQQKTTKFRLITIVNWKTWQNKDNKRTTDGQQADTNKNIKNIKNINIYTAKNFTQPTLEEVSEYCKERNNSIDPQHFIDHYQSNGWKVGRNQMKDWKAAVRTWERNKNKFSSTSPPKVYKNQSDNDIIAKLKAKTITSQI